MMNYSSQALPHVKKFNTFYKKINKNLFNSIIYYKSFGHKSINELLYNKLENLENLENFTLYLYDFKVKDEKIINCSNIKDFLFSIIKNQFKMIMDIDTIFTLKNIPLTENITVYKGIKKISKFIKPSFQFKNYLSTSINPNIALNFSSIREKCCILELIIPKGIPYLYLPWGKPNKILNSVINIDEFELLFPRGMCFRLIKKEKKKYPSKVKTYRHINKTETILTYTLKFEKIIKENIDSEELMNKIKRVVIELKPNYL